MQDSKNKKLDLFKETLLEFNKKLPLFSKKNEKIQLKNLFKDSEVSIKLLHPILSKAPKALDLGSGNGFPAIPLAIFYPKTHFLLCERNQKKAEFLRSIKHLLQLHNVEILNQDLIETEGYFKLILSKATAPLSEVLALLQVKLHSEGLAILWKSEDWEKEKLLETEFLIESFKDYERPWSLKKGVLLKITMQSSKKNS